MAYYFTLNKEINEINKTNETHKKTNDLYLNDNKSFTINSFTDFIVKNYKQILLFALVPVIIYVVDHITYYNTLLYGLTVQPGLPHPTTHVGEVKIKKLKKTKK